jgi:hypothetical protein
MQQDTRTMTQHCHATQHVPSSMVNTQPTRMQLKPPMHVSYLQIFTTAHLTATKLDKRNKKNLSTLKSHLIKTSFNRFRKQNPSHGAIPLQITNVTASKELRQLFLPNCYANALPQRLSTWCARNTFQSAQNMSTFSDENSHKNKKATRPCTRQDFHHSYTSK